MKDVISILQSRVAKRQNALAVFERVRIYDKLYWYAVQEQKQDKRILAEIVQWRRVARILANRLYRAEEI